MHNVCIGEDQPVRTGDKARSLALLPLYGRSSPEDVAKRIGNPFHRIDAHYGWTDSFHSRDDYIGAGL
jgi:hypothetical protein